MAKRRLIFRDGHMPCLVYPRDDIFNMLPRTPGRDLSSAPPTLGMMACLNLSDALPGPYIRTGDAENREIPARTAVR
jgi:hypothetical protein